MERMVMATILIRGKGGEGEEERSKVKSTMYGMLPTNIFK